MPLFLIRYNNGYGDNYEIRDCNDQSEAEDEAFAAWSENADADYSAELATRENCEDASVLEEYLDWLGEYDL